MLEEVRAIVGQTLQLGSRAESITADTRLLGEIPEMDSMAVVTVLTTLEESYGFVVDDDEISADTFATLGTLTEFVEKKINE